MSSIGRLHPVDDSLLRRGRGFARTSGHRGPGTSPLPYKSAVTATAPRPEIDGRQANVEERMETCGWPSYDDEVIWIDGQKFLEPHQFFGALLRSQVFVAVNQDEA